MSIDHYVEKVYPFTASQWTNAPGQLEEITAWLDTFLLASDITVQNSVLILGLNAAPPLNTLSCPATYWVIKIEDVGIKIETDERFQELYVPFTPPDLTTYFNDYVSIFGLPVILTP